MRFRTTVEWRLTGSIQMCQDMTKATLDELRKNAVSSTMALKRRVGYEENDTEGSMSSQLKRLRMDTLDEMDITEQE